MRTMIFGAGTDLGVNIDGASLGPVQLMNDLKRNGPLKRPIHEKPRKKKLSSEDD